MQEMLGNASSLVEPSSFSANNSNNITVTPAPTTNNEDAPF